VDGPLVDTMTDMPVRRMTAAFVVVALVALAVGGCGDRGVPVVASASADVASRATIATTDGATLTRLVFSDGSRAYLQQIDLRRMRIEQVIGDRDPRAASEAGRYYPAASSPRFVRIPPRRVQDQCQTTSTLFSIVNFAFFEEYDPSTRLSFPVKAHGTLLTGGSSPYGPVPSPSNAYFRTVTLQAFTWSDSGAAITPYDPTHGAPLASSTIQNGIVTYRYRDHPSYALDHDPPNRYQLLALSDPAHLLVVTVEHATLDTAADLLRADGATGEVLAFDGGISTYLWQANLGELVPITNRDGALPHYLCLLRRQPPST
jgi:hypothetical protein